MAIAVKPLPACPLRTLADAKDRAHRHKFAIPISGASALVPAEVVKTVCEPVANKRRPASFTPDLHPYLVATSLRAGPLRPGRTGADVLADETILACAISWTTGRPRSTFPRHYTGEVHIALKDGRTLVHREAMNRGCADRPLSNAENAEKFAGIARLSLSARPADEVREAVLGLDRAVDVRAAIDRICQAVPR
jgi:hypothetical protein